MSKIGIKKGQTTMKIILLYGNELKTDSGVNFPHETAFILQ
jgi:hypothetical protein